MMAQKKEKIYRVAMQLCRMWGVAETLTQDFIPYEKPGDNSLLMANEKRVLDWAAEFVNLQKDGVGELCDFFEQKIKELRHD